MLITSLKEREREGDEEEEKKPLNFLLYDGFFIVYTNGSATGNASTPQDNLLPYVSHEQTHTHF